MSTSEGSLQDKTAVKRISASLALEHCSLAKIHPFFSSQELASLAEVTGLAEAEICEPRSALGDKVRLPRAKLLLLDPRTELHVVFFDFIESPIGKKGVLEGR